MRAFNLLVSTYRNREEDCISELWYLLRELGDEGAEAWRTVVPGLVAVKTGLDPFKASKRLGLMASERPWDFKYRVTVNKRATMLRTSEVVEAVASRISRKVNLKNPDWTVLVEIVGEDTGVSVVKQGDVVSIAKMLGR